MIWVGLTGGIASGKSTVSNFLKREGAFIIDADKIVHHLLKKDTPVYRSITDKFGIGVLDADKEIDRKRLGEIVFRNSEKREQLNRIVHPAVFQQTAAKKRAITKEHPNSVIVFDAALLIETGAHKKMDWTLLAYVDRNLQLNRLIGRDKLAKEEATLRIGTQMPIDEKVAYVDEVIDCNQLLHKVKETVHEIYVILSKKACISE